MLRSPSSLTNSTGACFHPMLRAQASQLFWQRRLRFDHRDRAPGARPADNRTAELAEWDGAQLLANLTSLHVESVRTEVEWNRFDLLRFLDRCGFRPGQQLSLSRPLV